MEREGYLSRRRSALLVAAGLSWMPACDRVEAHSPLDIHVVYTGTPDAPILGISLEAGGPKVLFRGLATTAVSPLPLVGVPPGITLVFADGWSRYLRTRPDDSLSAPDLDPDPALVPPGWRLALGARATLAWSTAAEDGNAKRASLHAAGASRALALPPSRATWASVDDDGQRAVVGLRDSTILFDGQGAETLRLPAAAFGRLSRGGKWLALAHELEGKSTVSLVRTSDGGASYSVSETLLALAFDAAENRLAAISRRSVRVFALDGSAPKELLAIAAPTDLEWRSAAFGPAGQLALGGIRDVRHARRQGRDPAQGPVTAQARIVVEVRGPALQTALGEAQIDVKDWNSRSPELAFGVDGRLFAIVWPSGFEVELP